MNVSPSLEASASAAETMKPGMSAFDHPTMLAVSAAVSGPVLRDHWLGAPTAQGSPMPLGVVSAIGVDHAMPLNQVL